MSSDRGPAWKNRRHAIPPWEQKRQGPAPATRLFVFHLLQPRADPDRLPGRRDRGARGEGSDPAGREWQRVLRDRGGQGQGIGPGQESNDAWLWLGDRRAVAVGSGASLRDCDRAQRHVPAGPRLAELLVADRGGPLGSRQDLPGAGGAAAGGRARGRELTG